MCICDSVIYKIGLEKASENEFKEFYSLNSICIALYSLLNELGLSNNFCLLLIFFGACAGES